MMDSILSALDSCGIAWRIDGYEPHKPPSEGPYAAVLDDTETIGADGCVMATRHSVTIELYDDGFDKGREVRGRLQSELAKRNLKHHRSSAHALYNEKKHLTVFDIEDYYEKTYYEGMESE